MEGRVCPCATCTIFCTGGEEMKRILALFVCLICSFNAHAYGYVYIGNMSQLSWQLGTDGKVYLRNLSQFDANFLGCCYSYWVDTTTPVGKAIWSAMLLKIG